MEILRKLELQKTGESYEARAMELKAVSVVRALKAPAQHVTDAGPRGREPGERVELELLR
jgi:hypothetical protein